MTKATIYFTIALILTAVCFSAQLKTKKDGSIRDCSCTYKFNEDYVKADLTCKCPGPNGKTISSITNLNRYIANNDDGSLEYTRNHLVAEFTNTCTSCSFSVSILSCICVKKNKKTKVNASIELNGWFKNTDGKIVLSTK